MILLIIFTISLMTWFNISIKLGYLVSFDNNYQ
jgi:hypothetical protein